MYTQQQCEDIFSFFFKQEMTAYINGSRKIVGVGDERSQATFVRITAYYSLCQFGGRKLLMSMNSNACFRESPQGEYTSE